RDGRHKLVTEPLANAERVYPNWPLKVWMRFQGALHVMLNSGAEERTSLGRVHVASKNGV
ncbi:MAG: hypothetical protein ACRYFW_02725, partial [Janthinobacterium lividum]